MEIRELNTLEDMLPHLPVLQEMYPNLDLESYQNMLTDMIPNNYAQIGVFIASDCVAISGYWLATKLWCGRYLELDNVIVRESARGSGVGKVIQQYLEEKAFELQCNIMVLDAYTTNFKAHRFYYNQGYAPRGFHFIKILDEEGLT
ncbi:GNAT family N-acetyltransferase [Fluviicola chungangensis]|uniref:GNAT family N-acetyltransferase n=1 Tax=Fluviicola chungangensis TaxID=2597671 RepID=A0A556N7D0_9FLAO|nr:GNAT family N-acetyltransferase [Fluviicola chungangensis]TSJ48065.1 GNAT family N-acetyltransferase [Fluviicola chungangensis]